MKDTCGICDKPFPVNIPRFLHCIRHIQAGEATGQFDQYGNWRFEKASKDDTETESQQDLATQRTKST